MIEGRATARYVRTSAQKAGLVMDLIRGQNVDLALSTLRFARKRIARDIEKVLRSAVANAQQKEGTSGDVDRMFVSSCYADQGPSQKRVRPAPMGRAFRIIKRTAHLTVRVVERAEVVTGVAASEPDGAVKPARKSAATRTTRKMTAPPGKKPATAKKTAKPAMAKKTAKKATAQTTKKSAAKKSTD
jgi:large subunit ribosomal protein L22